MEDIIAARRLSAEAALILKLYLDPATWLARRIDSTAVRDIRQISWTSRLQVQMRFQQLEAAGIDVVTIRRQGEVVLPVILKARQLLTGFSVLDHEGKGVRTLTWEETRPLIEQMLVGTARTILAEHDPAIELDRDLERALRFFSGDIDEVRTAREWIDDLVVRGPDESPLAQQADVLFSDRVMRILIEDYTSGFIVMACARLREDGTCDLVIHHDDPIEDGRLRIPVAVSRDYQVEIALPSGAVFRKRPALESVDPEANHSVVALGQQRYIPIQSKGRKELEAWAEVRDALLAGYAPAQRRGTEWVLQLTYSVKNAPTGLVPSVQTIALGTTGMFAVGVVLRSLGVRPVEAAAALLAAVPSAYAILLFQQSDVPTRELVAREPRRWLLLIALVTLLGAGALAVRFPIGSPLERFGWGWRAFIWLILALGSALASAVVSIRSRTRW